MKYYALSFMSSRNNTAREYLVSTDDSASWSTDIMEAHRFPTATAAMQFAVNHNLDAADLTEIVTSVTSQEI